MVDTIDGIDRIIAKLQVLGSVVLSYNDFGVIYKTQFGDVELIKITYSLDERIIKTEKISGFSMYSISEHFIYLQYDSGNNQCAIYIRTSDKNLLVRNRRVLIYYKVNELTVLDGGLRGNLPIILYETTLGRVYALNYLGKRFEVTKYKPKDIKYSFMMQTSPYNTRVKIGYGRVYQHTAGEYPAYIVSEMVDWCIDTDYEFKEIAYNCI